MNWSKAIEARNKNALLILYHEQTIDILVDGVFIDLEIIDVERNFNLSNRILLEQVFQYDFTSHEIKIEVYNDRSSISILPSARGPVKMI